MLTHRATNAEAEGVIGFPRPRGKMVALRGAGNREAFQRFDKNGNPNFRPDPIVDVKGNPIVNSAGQAFDFVMPAYRTVEFTGRYSDFQRLKSLAERAGRLVSRIPTMPSRALLDGWRFSSPDDIWWAMLFEIAWADRHPLVTAKREIWAPSKKPFSFFPYDINVLRQLANVGLELEESIPAGWLKRLPDAFTSEIENVAAASFDAADYLLQEIDTKASNRPVLPGLPDSVLPSSPSKETGLRRRFAVAFSFPGEHRDRVGPVAKLLADVFGEPRVFYDRFHEVELSRPNLDLVLQRFYSEESDLVVVFVCGEYIEKEWCGIEWRAIREILKSRARADSDVMFLRLDAKPLPGLLSLDGYLDISNRKARQVADIILRRWVATR